MPVCAALLGVKRRIVILLSGVAVAGIGVYLVGYQSPRGADPFQSIRHLDLVFAFVVAYFAESWHFVAAGLGPAATIVALLAIAWIVVRRIQRPAQWEPLQAFAFSLALTMLLTAIISALGRQALGVGEARAGRYQTPAMLFWWALVLYLVTRLTCGNKRIIHYRAYVFVALQVVFLGAFVAEARRFSELLEMHQEIRSSRDTAGLAIEAGIYDESQIRAIHPRPATVPPTYSFLVQKGLMTPPFEEFSYVGKNLGSMFSVLPAASCLGSTDLIYRIALHGDGRKQDLFAAGWGYHPERKEAFRRVLAATPEGTIVGVGVSGVHRPDIAATHPESWSKNSGWRLYAVSEGLARPLLVYGILPGSNQACLLPGTRKIPAISAAQSLPPHFSISDKLAGYIESVNGVVVGTLNDVDNPVHVNRADNLLIEGWVLSGDSENAMDQVFGVYPGGSMAAVAVPRPDVSDHFKKYSLLMSGYRIVLPALTLGPGLHPIQIVGVRNDRCYQLPAVLYVYIS